MSLVGATSVSEAPSRMLRRNRISVRVRASARTLKREAWSSAASSPSYPSAAARPRPRYRRWCGATARSTSSLSTAARRPARRGSGRGPRGHPRLRQPVRRGRRARKLLTLDPRDVHTPVCQFHRMRRWCAREVTPCARRVMPRTAGDPARSGASRPPTWPTRSLRTPDERFHDPPCFPGAALHRQIDGPRRPHRRGPQPTRPSLLLLHGEPSLAFLWPQDGRPAPRGWLRVVALRPVGFCRERQARRPRAPTPTASATSTEWTSPRPSTRARDVHPFLPGSSGLIGSPRRGGGGCFASACAATTYLPTISRGGRSLCLTMDKWNEVDKWNGSQQIMEWKGQMEDGTNGMGLTPRTKNGMEDAERLAKCGRPRAESPGPPARFGIRAEWWYPPRRSLPPETARGSVGAPARRPTKGHFMTLRKITYALAIGAPRLFERPAGHRQPGLGDAPKDTPATPDTMEMPDTSVPPDQTPPPPTPPRRGRGRRPRRRPDAAPDVRRTSRRPRRDPDGATPARWCAAAAASTRRPAPCTAACATAPAPPAIGIAAPAPARPRSPA